MDINMSIANYSMYMSQSKVMNEIGTSVLKMSLDSFNGMSSEITKLMESSVMPDLGQNIHVKV